MMGGHDAESQAFRASEARSAGLGKNTARSPAPDSDGIGMDETALRLGVVS